MSAYKSQRLNWIKAEIARFANLVHAREAMLTVVTDIDLLSKKELEIFCKTSGDAGADYIKTSTGYLTKESSADQTALAFAFLPPDLGIKVYTTNTTLERIESWLNMGVEKVCVSSVDFLT
jgi:deoxyribose-phosphate aldolase